MAAAAFGSAHGSDIFALASFFSAIRTIFDHDDGLKPAKFPPHRLKAIILQHFGISDKVNMLDFLYGENFRKAHIASVCAEIAKGADEDALCAELFSDAGKILGRHLAAISTHFDSVGFEVSFCKFYATL